MGRADGSFYKRIGNNWIEIQPYNMERADGSFYTFLKIP